MRVFRDLPRRVREFAGQFLESTSGNTAMIFGLVAVTVIMAGGAGIDVARAVSMKTRLSSALDAAALAVGTQLDLTEDELEAMAQKYFDANYPNTALGTTTDVQLNQEGEKISLSVTGSVDTLLLRIININQFDLNVTNEVTRSANNIEVALVLDVTNSMSGTRIADLKVAANDMVEMIVQDVQTPYYTKMAIIPYNNAVNVTAGYAASIRGAITGSTTVTGAAWQTNFPDASATKSLTAATKTNPVVVTTSTNHGLVTGNKVWISGVGGMTQLNNKPYIVGTTTATTFQLKDVNNNNVNGTGYSNLTSAGTIKKCLVATLGKSCEVLVTAGVNGIVENGWVVLTGVNGMTQINNGTNAAWQTTEVTGTTYVLAGSMPSGTNPVYTAYTSGGTSQCANQGCAVLRFTNNSGGQKVFPISNCVSERTTNAYTDDAPSTTLFGRVYQAASPMASTTNPCMTPTITPLTDDKTTLHAQVNALAAGGSTGGHIGIGWGWYLVSPNFASLFPAVSQPHAYGEDHLFKIVILMTDGEYNSSYCNGVISQDSTSGSGSSSDHISCNAPNGHAYVQSNALCDAMKAPGKDVIVYTVGFDVNASQNAQDLVANCATDSEHAYYPDTGAELKTAFQLIAQEISQLRLSQ